MVRHPIVLGFVLLLCSIAHSSENGCRLTVSQLEELKKSADCCFDILINNNTALEMLAAENSKLGSFKKRAETVYNPASNLVDGISKHLVANKKTEEDARSSIRLMTKTISEIAKVIQGTLSFQDFHCPL